MQTAEPCRDLAFFVLLIIAEPPLVTETNDKLTKLTNDFFDI